MRIKRAIDIQSQLILRLKDEFSATRIYQRTCEQHIEAIKRSVTESKEYKRVPQHVRAYIRGAESILWDSLYAGKDAPLMYVIIGPDGAKYGHGDDTWLQHDSEYKSAMKGTHVWREAWIKGEYKIW